MRQAIFKAAPHLMRLDQIAAGSTEDVTKLTAMGGSADKTAFRNVIDDFYLTNAIARASATMAQCSSLVTGVTEAAE